MIRVMNYVGRHKLMFCWGRGLREYLSLLEHVITELAQLLNFVLFVEVLSVKLPIFCFWFDVEPVRILVS